MTAATPVWPGNQPGCRRAWDPHHTCCDSQGWPVTGEKMCFTETAQLLAEQRKVASR